MMSCLNKKEQYIEQLISVLVDINNLLNSKTIRKNVKTQYQKKLLKTNQQTSRNLQTQLIPMIIKPIYPF